MRVLVVKLSSLGDVIHTLPALSDAAAAVPGIRFDWVVEEAFAEIPRWHRAVDRVIPVAIRRWRKRPLRDLRGPEWRRARAELQRRRYDAVIDAQGLLKSAFITSLVKAPRYGMDKRSVRERLAATVYHHAIAVPREMHAVARLRLLFARALHYSTPGGTADYGLGEHFAAAQPASPGRLLFLHGTARPEKLWPRDAWVELAGLVNNRGYKVWLPWGDPEEEARARDIADRADSSGESVQVLPRLDLSGLAALLLEVRAAVAVDTGLGHLGAALDVPAVSLYGPTCPELIGTHGRHQVHIQAPPGAASAMSAISVAAVWRELQALLPPAGQPAPIAGGMTLAGEN